MIVIDCELCGSYRWYLSLRITTPFITMISWSARWRLKSPASLLLTQPFIQVQIKENTQASRHWLFVWGIHRGPVNFPHNGPVTRKMLPFDDVIISYAFSWGQKSSIIWINFSKQFVNEWQASIYCSFKDFGKSCFSTTLFNISAMSHNKLSLQALRISAGMPSIPGEVLHFRWSIVISIPSLVRLAFSTSCVNFDLSEPGFCSSSYFFKKSRAHASYIALKQLASWDVYCGWTKSREDKEDSISPKSSGPFY